MRLRTRPPLLIYLLACLLALLNAMPLYRPSNNRALPLYRCRGSMERTKAVCSRFWCQKGGERMKIAYNITAGDDRGP